MWLINRQRGVGPLQREYEEFKVGINYLDAKPLRFQRRDGSCLIPITFSS
jgi:hypothetical protein